MKETGTVKFFNEAKGFGFIKNEQGKDFFVHVSVLKGGTLNEGERVEFETREGKKGMEAFTAQLKKQATQIQKVSAQIELDKSVTKVAEAGQ